MSVCLPMGVPTCCDVGCYPRSLIIKAVPFCDIRVLVLVHFASSVQIVCSGWTE